jgi:predicted outer membrane protein
MEVEMGQMAQTKGKSADVKKIGSRMVASHQSEQRTDGDREKEGRRSVERKSKDGKVE